MIKKTITYTDYNGLERTEDFLFNMSKAELMEMEIATVGGYADMLKKIIDAQDQPTLVQIFKKFVLSAYGEKSPDGRQFVKSEALSTAFSQTPAYSILYMELVTDANAAAEFVNGVIPEDMKQKNAPLVNAAAN